MMRDFKNIWTLKNLFNIMIIWFFCSIVLVWFDNSIPDISSKVVAEMINITCIVWLVASKEKDTDNLTYILFTIGLIFWYSYFTWRDFIEPSYNILEKYIYVIVDMTMLVLLYMELLSNLKLAYVSLVKVALTPKDLIYSIFAKD